MTVTRSNGRPKSRVEIGAPSHDDALRLARELTQCHAQVVRTRAAEWVVRAVPHQENGRTLTHTLSAVERWLRDIGHSQTTVVVDGRSFTLDAPRRMFAAQAP